MRHVEFDYENLSTPSDNGRYIAFPNPRKIYYEIAMYDNVPDSGDKKVETEPKYGWKFHISIDDSATQNLAAGWNIIKDILIDHEIYQFKIVKPEILMHNQIVQEQSQKGKQITIYAHFQPNIDWQPILQTLTAELAAANINPSYRPVSDNPVNGSNYISYRYESQPNTYGKGYNPDDLIDPFDDIVVDVDAQLPVPEWHDALLVQDNNESNDANDNPDENSGCCTGCRMM